MKLKLARSDSRRLLVVVIAAAVLIAVLGPTTFDAPAPVPPPTANGVRLRPGDRLPFMATAYCKGMLTTAGVAVRSGIAASDPDLLPLGSIVQVESSDSRYDGLYTVLDTGPAVQGRHIDLYIWSCFEALDFGRTTVDLTVLRLGWNPRATASPYLGLVASEGEDADAR
jgi:3D (Asp-Asp-Asp) domain-containing protein